MIGSLLSIYIIFMIATLVILTQKSKEASLQDCVIGALIWPVVVFEFVRRNI